MITPSHNPWKILMEWIDIETADPDVLDVWIRLVDGSELRVLTQSDGDFWSECLYIFIDRSKVTAWMKAKPQ